MASAYPWALLGFLPNFAAAGEVLAPATAPTGLDVGVNDATSLLATWDTMPGVTGYEVEIRITP